MNKKLSEVINDDEESIRAGAAIDKTAMQSLQEASDYKYALEQSSMIAITDELGIIKYANRHFCKI